MKYILIGKDSAWLQAFPVFAPMADTIVKALNESEGEEQHSYWLAITEPINHEEIEVTLRAWEASGIQ